MRELEKADKTSRIVAMIIDFSVIVMLCGVVFSTGFMLLTGYSLNDVSVSDNFESGRLMFEMIALSIVFFIGYVYMMVCYLFSNEQTLGQYFVGIKLHGASDLNIVRLSFRVWCGFMFGWLLVKRNEYGMTFYDKIYATRLVKVTHVL